MLVWPLVEKQQEQGPRGDSVHVKKHQLRRYEDTTSSLVKRNTSSRNPGLTKRLFDLVDLRNLKPKNFVTGRWPLTIKTDKQGNFFKAKASRAPRCFQDNQKDYLQPDPPASTRPGFLMSCQMAARKIGIFFHIRLKRAFLQ